MSFRIKNLLKQILPKQFTSHLIRERQKKFVSSNEIDSVKVFIAANANVDNSTIGDFTSVGRYTDIHNAVVGKFCAISYFCVIGATRHYIDRLSVSAFPYVKELGFVEESHRIVEPVTIGNDVWIGCHSIIKPNVCIGDGAIIGANSVVTKNVPPYAIVAGVPAKIIKYRFSEDIITKLLSLKWWNLPYDFIRSNIDLWQKEISLDSIEKLLCFKEQIRKKEVK